MPAFAVRLEKPGNRISDVEDGPNAGISAQWIRRHRGVLVPAARQYYDPPLVLVSGQGRTVTDADGRSYLDFYGGILTVSIGHAHPKVAEAVEDQVRRLTPTSTLYVIPVTVELAERLGHLTPKPLTHTFFISSGTEANETAVAMAQDAPGGRENITLRHAYSGRSQLTRNLTGQASWRHASSSLPVRHAHNAYCYRCPFSRTSDRGGLECAKDLEELIQTSTDGHPAAFLAEPIRGVGGFITPPPAYFQEAARIVRDHGGLFIADEVQTGFGRTGRWFGIQHYDVIPDIMTLAKGMANGLPVGATVTTKEIAERYRAPTISTFGGSPIPMRAPLATLDVITDQACRAMRRSWGRSSARVSRRWQTATRSWETCAV